MTLAPSGACLVDRRIEAREAKGLRGSWRTPGGSRQREAKVQRNGKAVVGGRGLSGDLVAVAAGEEVPVDERTRGSWCSLRAFLWGPLG